MAFRTQKLALLIIGLVGVAGAAGGLRISQTGGVAKVDGHLQTAGAAASSVSASAETGSGGEFHRAAMAVKDLFYKKTELGDDKVAEGEASAGSYNIRLILQLLFGVIYYFVIVSKYPVITGMEPTAASIELQKDNEFMATLRVSPQNCLLSWCCSGPRAAHTFSATGLMNYWLGLFLMTCFPCCTLFGMNACTDLNEKLGGEKRNPLMACLCACFCSCCVIAQDAEALDLTAGVKTGFFGVYKEEAKTEVAEEKQEAKQEVNF